MRIHPRAAAVLAIALAAPLLPAPSFGQSAAPPPIALHVDASRATQGWLAMHETIPVVAGPLTLQYPKWIPGEHSPSGPLENLAGVVVRASGATIPWTRDLVDLYALHLTVPAGATSIEVDFAFVGASGGNYSDNRLDTPNLLSLTWNKVILTPRVEDYATQTIAPSLTLPGPDWKYATALTTVSHAGANVSFAPVSQEMLVDSPLDAGINSRTWELGTFNGAPVELAAFADTPDQLDAERKAIDALRKLVTQMHGLYRNRHFDHYTFLLTLSDVMPGEGVEHHQSSDDGTDGSFLTDHSALVADGDLLSHEWNHSWDGKYRRPFDLAQPNLQDPERDELLWVYEGMTQFYGELQAERAGIWTEQEWLDTLASTYAQLDTQRGRDWRPLVDTATAASVLYGAPRQWSGYRRGVDFYPEGALLWLEADLLIRRLSGGRRSLDDVARAFFGAGHDTGPMVVPYDRKDIIAALEAVQPYDWADFLRRRLDVTTPHPPDILTQSGYRLVYTDTMNAKDKLRASHGRRAGLQLRYSLGIETARDGTIVDVVENSPAFAAGVSPGEKIVAVDGRALSSGGGQSQLDTALKAHRTGPTPLRLLLSGGDVYREVAIDYHGGPRYPHLERIAGTADELGAIAKPY